jgi:glycosyltransferase involved in cell wall biosynthesis
MYSILLIIDQVFPNQHAFLEEVYAKLFPKNGDKIVWIFRNSSKRFRFERTNWHDTTVYTIPNEQHYNLFGKIIIKTLLFFWVSRIIKKERINLLQVRNWIFGAYLSYFFKILLKIPFVYQISFPVQEADIVIASQVSKRNKIRVWKNKVKIFFLRFAVKSADIVFVISEEMKQKMITEGFKYKKMIVIPLGFPATENPENNKIDELLKSLPIGSKKILLYVGTLSFLRKPEFMLHVLKGVIQHNSNVILLIVGGEPDEVQKLKAYAQKLGINKNLLFTGNVPRSKVSQYIALSDICISPIPEIPIYFLSSPTKFFEYIGLGKPVVASRIPEQEKIINASNCGICTNFNEDDFIAAILYLLNNEKEMIEMGRKGKEYAHNYLSYDKLYVKVLNSYRALS